VRSLTRDEFLAESAARPELLDRLVAVGTIQPTPDGRFDARDEFVASVATALLGAGIELDDLVWTLEHRHFGLRSLGTMFTEPVPRTVQTYAELASTLGDQATLLPAVYAALGLPEPEPGASPRADEARLIADFIRLWGFVDPTGDAQVRVARMIGDGTRRIAEGWLDTWDEVAKPGPTTQGGPTVGPKAYPKDPTDPEQNPSILMGELGRQLVNLVHERQVEATLTSRIIGAMEGVLGREGRLPARLQRPPAIAFVDVSGYTSLTVERGDEAAANVATRLFSMADEAVRKVRGRVVKQLGDGVLLRFQDSESAIHSVIAIIGDMAEAGLPSGHAGIAAGAVIIRDGDVFGATVNLASRIADRAGPGEVLVEEGVVVALPRGVARFEPVGRVELKGFPMPIALWRADPPAAD
jgi:adenylate cyclase